MLTTLFAVLHPQHKMDYFKRLNWPKAWQETARELVQAEYESNYAGRFSRTEDAAEEESDQSHGHGSHNATITADDDDDGHPRTRSRTRTIRSIVITSSTDDSEDGDYEDVGPQRPARSLRSGRLPASDSSEDDDDEEEGGG